MVGLGGLSAEEEAKLGAVGTMRRTGVHRAVPETALARGTWSTLPDGSSIWRVALQSNRATGMRIEFTNFAIGAGKVWVHTAKTVDGPYTDQGPYGNGTFWSGTVEGESLVIEYQPESGVTGGTPPFHVHRISHQALRLQDALPQQISDPAASCQQDNEKRRQAGCNRLGHSEQKWIVK